MTTAKGPHVPRKYTLSECCNCGKDITKIPSKRIAVEKALCLLCVDNLRDPGDFFKGSTVKPLIGLDGGFY